jgi:Arc/MetJ-type ribon-helix-helix transcriptional regulator
MATQSEVIREAVRRHQRNPVVQTSFGTQEKAMVVPTRLMVEVAETLESVAAADLLELAAKRLVTCVDEVEMWARRDVLVRAMATYNAVRINRGSQAS